MKWNKISGNIMLFHIYFISLQMCGRSNGQQSTDCTENILQAMTPKLSLLTLLLWYWLLKFKLSCDETSCYLRTIHFYRSNASSSRRMNSVFLEVHLWHFSACKFKFKNIYVQIPYYFAYQTYSHTGVYLTESFKNITWNTVSNFVLQGSRGWGRHATKRSYVTVCVSRCWQ